jgi:hypothetical protein
MSIGKISAATFFAENGLFKLLRHKDGDITKSYKTKTRNMSWSVRTADSKLNSEVMLNSNVVVAVTALHRV